MTRRTTAQRHNYLKAKVALALYSEYGRVPQETEIEHIYHVTCALFPAMLGRQSVRRQKKQRGLTGLV